MLESNIQGLHERNIYSIDWNETGILTGAGDNKVRLLVEDKQNGWNKAAEIELESDVNSGMTPFFKTGSGLLYTI